MGTGVKGLYAGAKEGLARDLPFEAMEFGTYESVQRVWKRIRGGRELGGMQRLVCGMVTGAVVGALLAPLDLVATRCVADPQRYRGVVSTMGRVVREEGVLTIFRGGAQKVGREAISSALFFAIYDGLRGAEERDEG